MHSGAPEGQHRMGQRGSVLSVQFIISGMQHSTASVGMGVCVSQGGMPTGHVTSLKTQQWAVLVG